MHHKKSVLVTGASGFTGSCVASVLINRGYHVVTTTREVSHTSNLNEVYLDLSKPDSIIAVFAHHSFDFVVHFGALVGFGKTEAELFIPNVVSSGLLANMSLRQGAKFIFASGTIVYGTAVERTNSKSPTNPDTAYGRRKWLTEELIRASGVEFCILRICGIFGFNGPEHLGINRAITAATHQESPIQMGHAEALRNYIYVRDVAEAVLFVIKSDVVGTHILAGSEPITISAMLRTICEIFVPDGEVQKKPGKEAKTQIHRASSSLPFARSFRSALADIYQELFVE